MPMGPGTYGNKRGRPATKKKKMAKKPPKKANGKNGLTAKQKTLPKFLQKKIMQKKGKK
tara:strand:+ start:2605 stop:2781 length:177 start_codon:yes stop_codon:yes gene_type:complete